MTKSQELRQKAAQKNKAFGSLLQKVADEGRSYTEEEQKQADTLRSEIEELEKRATDLEFVEKRDAEAASAAARNVERQAGGNPADRGEAREQDEKVREYRFTSALRSLLSNEPLTGVEKEMQEEARSEAAKFGQSVQGAAVPAFFMEARATATTQSAPSAGVTVDRRLTGLVEQLRPEPLVERMGANVITGLTGNLEVLRQTGATVANWAGEIDAAPETTPTFGSFTLNPKRLTAYTEASRLLLLQSSLPLGYENFLRRDLRIANELALDKALINGSGTGNVPLGILNTPGIGSVAGGTNGAALDRIHLLALMAAVVDEDAGTDTMAFLTNTKAKAKLMATKLDEGSGRFLMEDSQGTLLGYRTGFSNQVPSNITKGTGTNLTAVIFGDFRQLMVAQWGGLDLVVDPYTKARNATVALTINSFWDAAVRQPKAFAAMKDAITTLS